MKEFIKFVSIIFIGVIILTKGIVLTEAKVSNDIKLCIEGEVLPVKVQLYRGTERFGEAVDLDGKKVYTWKSVDLKNEAGEEYDFRVKIVGDEYGWIELGDRVFTTTYTGNIETGFTIVSEEQFKTVQPEPELAIAEKNRIIEFK